MKGLIQILLLEDSPKDAELIHATLEAAGLACGVIRVESEAAFRKGLDGNYDLIISDYSLPSFDGKRALALARQHRPDLPFIFVSGTIGEEAAVDSLLGGATDYVLKHKFGRLVPAVQRALKEAENRRARRDAERQLEITLAELKNLFDNLDEVFFSIDPRSNTLLQVSPASEKVYGLPREAFFDHPQFWKEFVHADDRTVVETAQTTLHTLQIGESVSCEYRILRPDGTLRWVLAKMKPVRDTTGEIVRIDGIVSDITERRELEAQFLRAQRMESLGSLAGGIAHDLNNVLSPIVMGIGLLSERHKDPDTQATLATLELCARRCANLVKQILMFARGVEGRRTNVDLGSLISNVERMFAPTLSKSIQVVIDITPHAWTVSADPTQLEQVLMNLFVNARDAMAGGGILTITVRNEMHRVHKRPDELKVSQYVMIQVSDTGQGIPPENLGRIFEPFFTTKEAGVGTGLGLSTVNAIVKNHGGFLTVDSNLESGTTFRVFLPALSSEAESMEIPERAADGFLSGNGELILVVDDETGVRDLVRTVLETYGYRVAVAANGDEGLAVYTPNRNDISLVLTDLDMPGKGGAELIRALEGINPAVRVISVSGLFEGNAPGQVVGGVVRAVLQKPFSPAELLKTLHDTLRSP